MVVGSIKDAREASRVAGWGEQPARRTSVVALRWHDGACNAACRPLWNEPSGGCRVTRKAPCRFMPWHSRHTPPTYLGSSNTEARGDHSRNSRSAHKGEAQLEPSNPQCLSPELPADSDWWLLCCSKWPKPGWGTMAEERHIKYGDPELLTTEELFLYLLWQKQRPARTNPRGPGNAQK